MNVFKSCLFIAMAFLAALLASAQNPGNRSRLYDPATEATIKGSVEHVTQPSRGRMSGTHLFVKTDVMTAEVALGPSVFISDKGFSFGKGDDVEVTGSKVMLSGKEYIIAREVVKDGKTLTLRNKNGIPAWAGQRKSPAN